MSDRTCKNYMTDGGNKLVIGGTLQIEAGAKVVGLAAANQAASTASTVAGAVADLNALIAKLKTAGLMAPDA